MRLYVHSIADRQIAAGVAPINGLYRASFCLDNHDIRNNTRW
jgi:hypothetical protein